VCFDDVLHAAQLQASITQIIFFNQSVFL